MEAVLRFFNLEILKVEGEETIENRDYQFFHENEVKVTLNMVRILRWLILAFPAIMFFFGNRIVPVEDFRLADYDRGWFDCNDGTNGCLPLRIDIRERKEPKISLTSIIRRATLQSSNEY